MTTPSYHDLHITTATIPRTSIFNLPFGIEVTCNRVAGWTVWNSNGSANAERWQLLAGEYAGTGKWLVLDVAGHVIVDGRNQEREAVDTGA